MNFRNFIYNGQQPGPAHSLSARSAAGKSGSLRAPKPLPAAQFMQHRHPPRTTHQLMVVRSCRIAFTFTPSPSPSPSRSRASNWN